MTFSPALLWFLAGVIFLITELLMPVFILIFFTAGCWIAGIAVWLLDIDLTTQLLVFIISSLVLLFTLRKYSIRIFMGTTRDSVDDHYADTKIGKTALVTKAITPGMPGEVKVMGSFWRAVAETSIEEGQSVVVESQESADGITLKVKSL